MLYRSQKIFSLPSKPRGCHIVTRCEVELHACLLVLPLPLLDSADLR